MITQEQFDKIFDLVSQIQKIAPEADTSSINMWLTHAVPSPLANIKVLIVDDDPDIVQAIDLCMKEAGAKTDIAYNGTTAIEMAYKEQYDLIILDMMLPQKSGFLVLEKIKDRNPTFKKPIIVMITGNPGTRHQLYARKLGVAEYLNKPFKMEKLRASCEEALKKAEAVISTASA